MIQPATEQTVEGDFSQPKVVLRGTSFLLQHRAGAYYITESELRGKPWEHRVDYTLGNRRLQRYMTRLEDGRILILAPTWDVLRKTWVHDLDTENPEEPQTTDVQIWNKSCYGCHVSQEKKNFELQDLTYKTTWQDLGVNCETCHGPGSEHVARASKSGKLDDTTRASINSAIVNPARLDPWRRTMICAQCHSFRDIYADGYRAGANFYDYFLPVMQYRLPASEESAYWVDGRPKWIANEVFAFWQSQCFLKGGATCETCHSNAHDSDVAREVKLRPDNNTACLGCHQSVAANISAHTHHAAESVGSSCIECHMPRVVTSLRAEMRDHSISVPVPRNTTIHNIPNACNLCHKDRDADWAQQQSNQWYGPDSGRRTIRRADAFTGGSVGDPESVSALLQILGDPSEGPLLRANAAGYLGSFPDDPSAYEALLHSFSDSEPLVRATAAIAVRPRAAQRAAVAPALVALLRDPAATVQVTAAIALVGMGVKEVPPEDAQSFEHAKKLYRGRAELDSDDAQQQFAAGRFALLTGDFDGAVSSFRAALKLDSSISAQYYLARALAEKRDFTEASAILKAIPANDPQYESAQRLLAQIQTSQTETANAGSGAVSNRNAEAQAKFTEGESLYQGGNYGGALQPLEDALRLAPNAEWASKARIYRAICLAKLARTSEAEAAMQELAANPAARENVDLQLAFVELLYENGRLDEALKRVDALIAAVPKAPMAYFWRAKVLLQMHRVNEAATAAEQSIRLLPDLPEPHNLLIRIYQMQGRTADAAKEAEWVRDYERRVQSR
jgi:predicted CXXCH cytochrome family protein